MENKNEENLQKKNDEQKVFDFDFAFSNFLSLRGIDARKLVEKKGGYDSLMEIRHAYFGGLSQMYVVLAMDVPRMGSPELQTKAVNYVANILNDYASNNPVLMEQVKAQKAAQQTLAEQAEQKIKEAGQEEFIRSKIVDDKTEGGGPEKKSYPGPTPVK